MRGFIYSLCLGIPFSCRVAAVFGLKVHLDVRGETCNSFGAKLIHRHKSINCVKGVCLPQLFAGYSLAYIRQVTFLSNCSLQVWEPPHSISLSLPVLFRARHAGTAQEAFEAKFASVFLCTSPPAPLRSTVLHALNRESKLETLPCLSRSGRGRGATFWHKHIPYRLGRGGLKMELRRTLAPSLQVKASQMVQDLCFIDSLALAGNRSIKHWKPYLRYRSSLSTRALLTFLIFTRGAHCKVRFGEFSFPPYSHRTSARWSDRTALVFPTCASLSVRANTLPPSLPPSGRSSPPFLDPSFMLL